MSLRNETRKPISKEYGRRPYVNPKDTHRDRMKRVTDKAIFNAQIQRQSEFKKPYLDTDYQDMEYGYPSPFTNFSMYNWGGGGSRSTGWGGGFPQPFDMPEFAGPAPDDEEDKIEGWIGWYVTGCVLECTDIGTRTGQDDYDAKVHCCKLNPAWQSVSGAQVINDFENAFRLVSFNDLEICFEVDGAKVEQGKAYKVQAYTIPRFSGHTKGGACEDTITINCCSCDNTANPFGWPDSNPDTMGQSDSVAITISGGCAPYSWSVTGSGFTLGSATTSGASNTLITDGSACGPGNVTVTDKCGNVTAAGVVRSTTGSWQYHSDCDLNWTGAWQSCGGAPEANDPGAESIVGKYKFLFPAGSASVKCYCSSSTNGSGGYEWVLLFGTAGQCGNVPAGAANAQCTNNACAGGCIQTHGFFGSPSIQEWKC